MGSGVSGSHLLDLCLQICEIGITPDELKQIVREAVLESLRVKNDASAEMKYYTRYETCKLLQISLSTLDTYVKKRSNKMFPFGKGC